MKTARITETIKVKSYIEAAGRIMAMRAGIDPGVLNRPMKQVRIFKV